MGQFKRKNFRIKLAIKTNCYGNYKGIYFFENILKYFADMGTWGGYRDQLLTLDILLIYRLIHSLFDKL